VVYYANYFIYFERLRNELLRKMGLCDKALEENGLMLPVTEAVCNYKSPARYDDLLTISGWVESVKGPRITICCEVYCSEQLLVTGHTVHASINSQGRPVRPPSIFTQL